MNKLVKLLLGLPKTILINFKLFPLATAIKLPVILAPGASIEGISKGSIEIRSDLRTGLVNIGFFEGMGGNTSSKTKIEFRKNGKIIFDGNASIAKGSSWLAEGATIRVGDNFHGNANLKIICRNGIKIGNNVLISWNCSIMDSDGHNIVDNQGSVLNVPKMIIIEDKVWIGAEVMILKGTIIPEQTVIGARSLVTKKLIQSNCVYAMRNGELAKVKEEIVWKQ